MRTRISLPALRRWRYCHWRPLSGTARRTATLRWFFSWRWSLLFGVLGIIRGNVGDILVGQAGGNAIHRRMFAVALFVSIQRRFDIFGRLPADHRYLVHLGKAGLVTGNAVA